MCDAPRTTLPNLAHKLSGSSWGCVMKEGKFLSGFHRRVVVLDGKNRAKYPGKISGFLFSLKKLPEFNKNNDLKILMIIASESQVLPRCWGKPEAGWKLLRGGCSPASCALSFIFLISLFFPSSPSPFLPPPRPLRLSFSIPLNEVTLTE